MRWVTGFVVAATVAFGQPIEIKEVWVGTSQGRGGRQALTFDQVQTQMARGVWTLPSDWKQVQGDGTFTDNALRNGYAYAVVTSDRARAVILEAQHHNMVYVNGEPRMGDPYGWGFVKLPIKLRVGQNHLLFACARGRLQARFTEPLGDVYLLGDDLTFPDIVSGERHALSGAIVAINATDRAVKGIELIASGRGFRRTVSRATELQPLSIRKLQFNFASSSNELGERILKIELAVNRKIVSTQEVKVRCVNRTDNHRRTFISDIDESVQYYAANPIQNDPGDYRPPALVLSLHGAGVEALGQANAYSSKSWATLIAPTNRRPYGFDWEDWGRLDAIEALEHAERLYRTDPKRVYLTGHSMGGHGTWHLGVTFPDRFAAIAPCAGWISFFSYGGARRPDELTPFDRAASASDTMALLHNLRPRGVYILHGGADSTVPPREARQMFEALKAFHTDVAYHEEEGQGHWYDTDPEPGANCVDWAPIFELFARRTIPDDRSVLEIDFRTAAPSVSSRMHWLTIESQVKPFETTRVAIKASPHLRSIEGTTENAHVVSFALDALIRGTSVTISLDGQKLENVSWPSDNRLYLEKTDQWRVVSRPPPEKKNPSRSGPFKDAFRNRAVLVYGTMGTLEENAWSFAKARYDAEQFYVRGNGSFDLVADRDFRPTEYKDRNVIIYGNRTTNSVYTAMVGGKAPSYEDLPNASALFIRPRADSNTALIAVIGGASLQGMKATDRLPYFVSGTGYPDYAILRLGDEGWETLKAGFYNNDWKLD